MKAHTNIRRVFYEFTFRGYIFRYCFMFVYTFTSKAPNGGKAMGALANAAIASF